MTGALLVAAAVLFLLLGLGNAGSSVYADKIRFLILLSSGVRLTSDGAVSCPLDVGIFLRKKGGSSEEGVSGVP